MSNALDDEQRKNLEVVANYLFDTIKHLRQTIERDDDIIKDIVKQRDRFRSEAEALRIALENITMECESKPLPETFNRGVVFYARNTLSSKL